MSKLTGIYKLSPIMLLGIFISCMACTPISQQPPELTIFESQFHNVKLVYPQNKWKIEELDDQVLVTVIPNDESWLIGSAEIAIIPNPLFVDTEENFEGALQKYITTILLEDKERLIHMDPVEKISQSQYNGARTKLFIRGQLLLPESLGQPERLVATALPDAELGLAIHLEVILIQEDHDRLLIISSWPVVLEKAANITTERQEIVQSIQFRE